MKAQGPARPDWQMPRHRLFLWGLAGLLVLAILCALCGGLIEVVS